MYSIREIISIIVFIVLLGIFWQTLGGFFASPVSYWLSLAAFVLAAAGAAVSAVLIRSWVSFAVASAGAAILFLLFFGVNIYNLAGVLLFALFSVKAFLAAKSAENDSLKISFAKLAKSFLPQFLTAVFLLISLAFYFSPLSSAKDLLLSRPVFDYALKAAYPMVSGMLPPEMKITPEMTADEAVISYALAGLAKEGGALPVKYSSELLKAAGEKGINVSGQKGLENILADAELSKILIADVGEYLKKNPKMFAELRAGAGEAFGVELKGGEKISDILFSLANEKFEAALGQYGQYLPAVSAILLFLTLKSAGSLLTYAFAFAASGALYALFRINAISIYTRDVKKEIIM